MQAVLFLFSWSEYGTRDFADLKARLQSKLLRGLMFVHMKAGLYVEPISWSGCQESYTPPHQTPLTPSGVRRDVQQALSELRTDLDDFIDEADYLMACGYQMAAKNFEGSLASIEGLASEGARKRSGNSMTPWPLL
jgi:hypothetical protein